MQTILLIDDDAAIRTIFGLSLRKHGYHVIEASSGYDGYALARQQRPDLILTDISMPEGNGQSVLHYIRHDPELRSRQVVLMTGRPDTFTARTGMEAGADDFLQKPFTQEALLRCVEARLQRAKIYDYVEKERKVSLPPNLSHEFFTPLNGIIGLSELLMDRLDNLPPAEVRSMVGDILKTGLRLHRTLRNYLMILDLEASPYPEKPQSYLPLSPDETQQALLSGIHQALGRVGREKDARIEIHQASIPISADDLSLIAEELVDNACNFSPVNKPIVIQLDKNGIFTVTDAGRGMTREQIEKIGAFHQFDRKKYEQQGLGLGLVLAQKLTARCGASFSIDSRLSEGTQVKIDFPIERKPSRTVTGRFIPLSRKKEVR